MKLATFVRGGAEDCQQPANGGVQLIVKVGPHPDPTSRLDANIAIQAAIVRMA
jgi:hypothetical protein